MTELVVLDLGMGNLRSVAKALERAGAQVIVSPEIAPDAAGLVVPGQGAFGACVRGLGDKVDQVRTWIARGRPYLGICLGFQVLFDRSEEDPSRPGIGVFAGEVLRLRGDVKVPHIGWNEVHPRRGSALFAGTPRGARFYFDHSYAPAPKDMDVCAATTEHGVAFCSAAEAGHIFATQFHPEKSGADGIALLRNFVSFCSP